MSIEITINLPNKTFLRNVAGEPVNLDWSKVEAGVIAKICEGGAKVLLTNAFNGGGKDASESERLAAMQKRMDAWARGEYAITERGPSMAGLMRECYVADVRDKTSASEKAVDDAIKARVAEVFGPKEKATFPAFLRATAKLASKVKGESRSESELLEALEAKWEKAAAELSAARADADKALDLGDIDLGL